MKNLRTFNLGEITREQAVLEGGSTPAFWDEFHEKQAKRAEEAAVQTTNAEAKKAAFVARLSAQE